MVRNIKKDYPIKDKYAIMNVLAGIVKDPMVLMDDHYQLVPDDFPERFHRIVFGALEHVIRGGAKNVDALVIDDYLQSYKDQYKIFTDNNGVAYINSIVELTDGRNFAYFYTRLKKASLLNRLYQQGFDISDYWDPSIVAMTEAERTQTKFDTVTLEEILDDYEIKLGNIKDAFGDAQGRHGVQAGTKMKELKEELKAKPEIGAPMNSAKMTTICRGRRLKKFYLKVAPSGCGKTRLSLADACLVSIPKRFDLERKRWVKTGCQEPTLFITTELEIEEVQTMIQAYVSGVPEEHILDGKYEPGEEARVDKAISVIQDAPLWIEHVPDFNVDDIENIIKEHKLKHQIAYCFFDYIFTSIKILTEVATKARGVKLREDNVLVMFSDRLKGICNKLNVHIDTSTQVSGDWKNAKDPDASLIRGAKGIADKVDVGYVVLEPTPKDLEAVKSILAANGQAFGQKPNLVFHVFKLRRGKLNHVKVFVHFDFSTLRTTDMFVTDRNYQLLSVDNTSVEMLLDQTDISEEADKNSDKAARKW